MKYGTLQTVEEEHVAATYESAAKNLCIRAAWAAGYQPIGKPVATCKLTSEGWLLRVLVDVEPRLEENAEQSTDGDFGFA